jgi:hypothetical protein
MRIRSAVTVFALTGLLLGGVVRCALPDQPDGPTARSTTRAYVHVAVVSVPPGTLDSAALIASLKELTVTTVILANSADETGSMVDQRVALAIEVQRGLDADVFIGSYESPSHNGKTMEQLLAPDSTFTTCYPNGPKLDPNGALIDNLRVCSQDTSGKIATALQAQNASARIGCAITQRTELLDSITDDAKAKLAGFFHDAAGACADAGRAVAISPMVSARSGDPDRVGVLMREMLQDSGVASITVHDGVGALDAGEQARATDYYQGLRNALQDREPTVLIWANVEAFDCDTPDCTKRHPTSRKRYLDELCVVRGSANDIVTSDFLRDLTGKSVFTSPLDGSAEVEAIAADIDAAAALRASYLEWRDGGAFCPPPALDAGAGK